MEYNILHVQCILYIVYRAYRLNYTLSISYMYAKPQLSNIGENNCRIYYLVIIYTCKHTHIEIYTYTKTHIHSNIDTQTQTDTQTWTDKQIHTPKLTHIHIDTHLHKLLCVFF